MIFKRPQSVQRRRRQSGMRRCRLAASYKCRKIEVTLTMPLDKFSYDTLTGMMCTGRFRHLPVTAPLVPDKAEAQEPTQNIVVKAWVSPLPFCCTKRP